VQGRHDLFFPSEDEKDDWETRFHINQDKLRPQIGLLKKIEQTRFLPDMETRRSEHGFHKDEVHKWAGTSDELTVEPSSLHAKF
jgi:hypothetical protein